MRIWEERDSASQQLIAIHTHHFAWGTERTIWMDGRPHPPDYALHTAMGFSTGKWERRHPDRDHDASEGRLDAAQRSGAQRHGDGHRALHPPRRSPDAGDDRQRSGVSTPSRVIRSRDYEYEVGGDIGPYPCEPVEEVVRPKGAIPHHLPGTNPFLERIRQGARRSARGGARRRGDDVSRVPEEDRGEP